MSESFDDVSDATQAADMGVIEDASFAPADQAELTTCNWRVDETAAIGEVRIGPVWPFITYLPIDEANTPHDSVIPRGRLGRRSRRCDCNRRQARLSCVVRCDKI